MHQVTEMQQHIDASQRASFEAGIEQLIGIRGGVCKNALSIESMIWTKYS